MTNYFELFDKRLHAIEEQQKAILERLFVSGSTISSPETEKPLALKEAAKVLGCAEQTIYQNIKKIPHKKRFGKLYFFESELLDYLKGGQVK